MIKLSRLLTLRGTHVPIHYCEQCAVSANDSNFISRGGFCLQRNVSSKRHDKYSSDEQKLILQILNENTTEELKRFAISKQRAHYLYNFRAKCGHFTNLEQVLQVKSFGELMLEQMCDNILTLAGEREGSKSVRDCKIPKDDLKVVGRSRVPLAVPTLEKTTVATLRTAVGVHIGHNTVSWASIDKTGNLLQWDLFSLNVETKRMHPTIILETVMEIRRKIPDSDVYVMEDALMNAQTPQLQVNSLSIQLHKSQLSAMLIAVLNTTSKSLDNVLTDDISTCLAPLAHRVYFLRSRLTARLFRTMVGSERVSAQTAVHEIISPPSQHTDYSPLAVDSDLKQYYLSKNNIEKEHLCQSLLLTMSFMDLVVYENPRSIKVATGR